MTAWTLFEAQDAQLARLRVDGGDVTIYSCKGPEKLLNEDAAAVLPVEGGVLLLVCDGMGGHNAGERASRAAIETVASRLSSASLEEAPRHTLLDGIEEANRAVLALGLGAGATLAAVIVRNGRARSAHVGDAAALHVGQRGLIKAQTMAHSPTSYAVEAGLLDAEEALHHDERHLVSNHIGMEGMRVEIGPEVVVAARDTLLLASDGLFDNVRDEEVIELVRKGDPEEAAQRLAELARRRMLDPTPGAPSKPDDLTFIVYRRRD